MADNRTMTQLLQAPTEGYEDAIVIPEINANFELKHGLINLLKQTFLKKHDKEDPHAHIRYFNKITSTMRFPDIPSTSIKLMLFPFSLEDTFYNALNANDQDSLNSAAGGNFLNRCLISPNVAALTTEVSELKNMMKTMLIDKQKAQAPVPVKAVEQSCVTCRGAHSYINYPTTDGNIYRDNIQEFTKDVHLRLSLLKINNPVSANRCLLQLVAPMLTRTYQFLNPSRRNDEKRRENADEQKEKFYEIFKDMSFEISFMDALTLMPKFASTLKSTLLGK
ncbi:hypothetical protein Tco_0568538 [Tanacetum coccineum]